MNCPNCNTELNDNAKFCKNCGEKILTTVEEKQEKEKIIKKEEIVNNTQKNNNNNNNQTNYNAEVPEKNVLKEKLNEFWKKLNIIEKILTCLSGVFLLELIISIIAGKQFAMIISIIQIVGIIITFLIEKNVIKTSHKWLKYIIPVICILLTFLYFNLFSSQKIDYRDAEKIVWTEMIIANNLPEPPKTTGDIESNTDERLCLDIYNISIKQFYEYIEKCKNVGFTIDNQKSEYNYSAYNEDGYCLKLYYSDYDDQMNIDLSISKKYENITWSESAIAKLIPTPKSLVGEIIEDNEKKYDVIISNMTLQDYTEYISLCENSGFTNNVEKNERTYNAKNNENYRLCIEYIGNNVIEITIEEPEYDVNLSVECVENWVFSKYNVEIYIDDSFESTLTHGATEDYSLKLSKGTHKIKFVNEEDESITGEFTTEVGQNGKIELKLNCYSYEISIESKSNSVIKSEEPKEEDKKEESVTEDPKVEEKKEEPITEEPKNEDKKEEPATEEPKEEVKEENKVSVSYSTNDYETAKNGNTGVYSYIKEGKFYDIYYIIDFDNGFVYYFNEGEGNDWCDKLKIKSGDLNSKLLYTYHDGGDTWDEALYFKYKNQPSILIMEDGNHFQNEFEPTNLDKALKLRDTKNIKDR